MGSAADAPAGAPDGLLSLALDPSFSTPDDPASMRILDAAVELAAGGGTRAVTMDAVAERAGVGRMTVYRRFGHKDHLVQAMAVRETRRSLERVAAALDPDLGVEERFEAGFVATLRVAREHPLLAGANPVELLRAINDPGDRTVDLICEFLAELIREGQRSGEMRPVEPRAAAELLFRIGISFVLMPGSVIDVADEAASREAARTLIAPIVAA